MIVLATLLTLPTFGQDRTDPGEAIYGEWEIVEMVFRRTVQDLGGGPGGWFIFERGGFDYLYNVGDRTKIDRMKANKSRAMDPCVIRPRELDISNKDRPDDEPMKALWELKDGTLRVIWREGGGERPTDFDEAYKDPRQTLFVLKKAK